MRVMRSLSPIRRLIEDDRIAFHLLCRQPRGVEKGDRNPGAAMAQDATLRGKVFNSAGATLEGRLLMARARLRANPQVSMFD